MKIGKREVKEILTRKETICDLCKQPIKWWDFVKGEDIGEIHVQAERTEDNDDYERGNEYSDEKYRKEYYYFIDICNDCFFTKIKPYIELIGGTFRRRDRYEQFDEIVDEAVARS